MIKEGGMDWKEIEETGLTGFGYWMSERVKGSCQVFYLETEYIIYQWVIYKEEKEQVGN